MSVVLNPLYLSPVFPSSLYFSRTNSPHLCKTGLHLLQLQLCVSFTAALAWSLFPFLLLLLQVDSRVLWFYRICTTSNNCIP